MKLGRVPWRAQIGAVAVLCLVLAVAAAGATVPDRTKLRTSAGELEGHRPWMSTMKFLHYRKHAAAILLDSAARWSEGEPRQPIEWKIAQELTGQRWRIILAAGLTPENVARAVATARPYAVDVNSGVEAQPGRKDPDKVWRFVAEAKGVR